MVALFFRRRDRTLLIWAAVGTALLTFGMIFAVVGSFFAAQAGGPRRAAELLRTRPRRGRGGELSGLDPDAAAGWAILTPAAGRAEPVVPIVMLLAFWAGRREILERPRRPPAAAATGGGDRDRDRLGRRPTERARPRRRPPRPRPGGLGLQRDPTLTGMCAGVGYVAAFGLLGQWIAARAGGYRPAGRARPGGRRRWSPLPVVLSRAVGLCAPLLSAWGLGLGAVLGSATAALFAIAVWLMTSSARTYLERRDRRGPAEVLLRQLRTDSAKPASRSCAPHGKPVPHTAYTPCGVPVSHACMGNLERVRVR